MSTPKQCTFGSYLLQIESNEPLATNLVTESPAKKKSVHV